MEKGLVAEKSSYDIESAGHVRNGSSITRISLKMSRVVLRILSRRTLALAAGLSFFLFLAYNSNARFALNGACITNRSNADGVRVPPAQESAFLNQLWDRLHTVFDQHIPSPAHIDQPKHKGFPSQEDLGQYFSLTDEQAKKTRSTHKGLVEKLPPFPRGHFKGRGVVVLAGGRYSEYAATTVGMLREIGSKLPVEVWSKDHAEEMSEWCKEIYSEGMACRRLADYMDVGALKHPYQWKVFTLLFSTFSDILFLDADSMPVRNPDFVFDSKIYKEKGVILWSDYWKHTGSPWLPYLIGISDDKSSDMLLPEMSVESGQIYWNKESHWKSLTLAAYYNYHGPDFWYTVFNNGMSGWGDKDTFPMALKALRQPYHHVKPALITLFITGTMEGIGMAQADPTIEPKNKPLFLHSNMVKWSMRELLCEDKCEPIPGHGDKPSHWTNDKSKIHGHLRSSQRIFGTDELFRGGVDPEPTLWRAVEHTACRSPAWSKEDTCRNVRMYMDRTFGYKFEKDGQGNRADLGNGVCMTGPNLDQHGNRIKEKGEEKKEGEGSG